MIKAAPTGSLDKLSCPNQKTTLTVGLVLSIRRARQLLTLHRGLEALSIMCASDVTETLDLALAASRHRRAPAKTSLGQWRILRGWRSSQVA